MNMEETKNNKATYIIILFVSASVAILVGAFQSGFPELRTPFTAVIDENICVSSSTTTGTINQEQEPLDIPPPAHLKYLRTVTTDYSDFDGDIDLYVGEDTVNGFRILHEKDSEYETGATIWPVVRIYPNTVSDEEMVADYLISDYRNGVNVKLFQAWFDKSPLLPKYDPFKSVVSANLITRDENYHYTVPPYIKIPENCFQYMPGSNCQFEVTNQNPYGWPAATLYQQTGPYEWSGNLTPYGLYVTKDNKVLIMWNFGDAGGVATEATLWDPKDNTHRLLSESRGFSETLRDLYSTLIVPHLNREYNRANFERDRASTTPLLKLDPFSEITIYGNKLMSDCYGVSFYPSDWSDPDAHWLLEYHYGCYEDTIQGLSVWYELDPVNNTQRRLTEILPY